RGSSRAGCVTTTTASSGTGRRSRPGPRRSRRRTATRSRCPASATRTQSSATRPRWRCSTDERCGAPWRVWTSGRACVASSEDVDEGARQRDQGGVVTVTLELPELCLVVLVGVTGSGKSTFARKHFKASQVLSSDAFRAMLADDENDQAASADAFEALHYIAGKRLGAGRLTVVDATNVQEHARAGLVAGARAHDVLPVA